MKKLHTLWIPKALCQALAVTLCAGASGSVYGQVKSYVAGGAGAHDANRGVVIIGYGASQEINSNATSGVIIGREAKTFDGGGKQEVTFSFIPAAEWQSTRGYKSPSDTYKDQVLMGLSFGYKSFSRAGSLDIGNKTYPNTTNGFVAVMTTVGSNSANKGIFSSILGSYNKTTGGFNGSGFFNTLRYGAQNFTSTIVGSLNTNPAQKSQSGIANSIIGIANSTPDSNGSLIFGSGNNIKNSLTSFNAPTSGANSPDELRDTLSDTINSNNSAGSTMAFGGGNIAQKTLRTSVIGVNNTIESAMRMNTVLKCPDDTDWGGFNKDKCFASSDWGKSSPRDPVYVQEKADYAITNNFVSGVSNQITGVNNSVFLGSNNNISMADNITLLGDNRVIQGTTDAPISHVIAIGSVDANTATDTPAPNDSKKITTSGAVAIGHNTYVDPTSVGENAQGAAVALGENSVAHTATGQVGYDAKTGTTYTPEATTSALTAANAAAPATPDATWKATADAITVGDVQYTNSELTNAGTAITRQITGVAAGKEDTDMVNVAQIKRVKDTLSQKADAAKVIVEKGNDNIVVTPDNIDTPSRYTVGLTPDVHVQSLTVGEGKEVVITTDGTINLGQGKTIVNDQGIMVSDGPQMTAAGIASNNTIISNAANGVVDSDAATVGQLNTINRDIAETQKTTLQLQRSARKMRNELRGIGANIGVAMALPQAILPGKAMIAAAVGTYRDESALAVGWSRASEKGKYLFKISGSINTNNDTGVSVGFGVRYK